LSVKKSEALKAIINPYKKEKSDTKSHQKMQEGLLAKGKRKGGKKKKEIASSLYFAVKYTKFAFLF
jgi:hypothetical protein